MPVSSILNRVNQVRSLTRAYEYFRNRVIQRALHGQGLAYTILAVGMVGVRQVRRQTARAEQVDFREELAPGESLLITHTTTDRATQARLDKDAKREAKAQAKAARKQKHGR